MMWRTLGILLALIAFDAWAERYFMTSNRFLDQLPLEMDRYYAEQYAKQQLPLAYVKIPSGATPAQLLYEKKLLDGSPAYRSRLSVPENLNEILLKLNPKLWRREGDTIRWTIREDQDVCLPDVVWEPVQALSVYNGKERNPDVFMRSMFGACDESCLDRIKELNPQGIGKRPVVVPSYRLAVITAPTPGVTGCSIAIQPSPVPAATQMPVPTEEPSIEVMADIGRSVDDGGGMGTSGAEDVTPTGPAANEEVASESEYVGLLPSGTGFFGELFEALSQVSKPPPPPAAPAPVVEPDPLPPSPPVMDDGFPVQRPFQSRALSDIHVEQMDAAEGSVALWAFDTETNGCHPIFGPGRLTVVAPPDAPARESRCSAAAMWLGIPDLNEVMNMQPWHGSHIAGLMVGGDGFGVNPTQAMSLYEVALEHDKTFVPANTTAVLTAIEKIIGPEQGVLNISLEISVTPEERRAIGYLLDRFTEKLVVAAAGNKLENLDSLCTVFPACRSTIPHLLAVSAVDEKGRRWQRSKTEGSATGKLHIDIVAPAEATSAVWVANGVPWVASVPGTSQAAAIVSGVARRLWKPGRTPEEIRNRLISTADISVWTLAFSRSGRINAARAALRKPEVITTGGSRLVADHICLIAGDAPPPAWSGDGCKSADLPDLLRPFHTIRRMHRIPVDELDKEKKFLAEEAALHKQQPPKQEGHWWISHFETSGLKPQLATGRSFLAGMVSHRLVGYSGELGSQPLFDVGHAEVTDYVSDKY